MGNAYGHFSSSLAVLNVHPDYISVAPGNSLDKRASTNLCTRLQSFSFCEQIIEKGREASWKVAGQLLGFLWLFHIIANLQQPTVSCTYQFPACNYLYTYQSSYLLWPGAPAKAFKSCENIPVSLLPTAQLILLFTIASSSRINCSKLLLPGSIVCYVPPFWM